MEELLTRIGELIATELEGAGEVTYLEKEMGYMFRFEYCGKNVLLSVIDLEECGNQ